ncbi:mucin-5AC-like isoform X2 [Ananas comosus]|uniref:Mucin-5AC-like isoform X2 n=1 Tax=Ananas comosus TaxID=4615 RepID=A0A6P5EPY1_ANACO|nr:mucin-5AC-like isoform X2 [Ananas comosus]
MNRRPEYVATSAVYGRHGGPGSPVHATTTPVTGSAVEECKASGGRFGHFVRPPHTPPCIMCFVVRGNRSFIAFVLFSFFFLIFFSVSSPLLTLPTQSPCNAQTLARSPRLRPLLAILKRRFLSQMCSTVESVLLKPPNSWSVLPRAVPDKTHMHESRLEASFSYNELEKGEFRVNQSFMPGEDIASLVHSERTSHDLEEMEHCVNIAVKASVPGLNTGKNLVHENSSEIRMSDCSVAGKKRTRVCWSPIPEEVGSKEASENFASISSEELEEGEIRENLNDTGCSEHLDSPNMIHQEVEPCENELLRKRIEEVYSGRLEELLWQQKAELKEYKIMRRKQHRELIRKYYLDVDQIHAKCVAQTARNRKRKLLKRKFKNLRKVFRRHMKLQFRKFVVMQIEARNREKKIMECWMEKANSGTLEQSFDELPLSETGFKLRKFKFHEPCESGCSEELSGSAESFEEGMLFDQEESDSQSGYKSFVEFYGPVEPDYGTSATFQPVGEDNSIPLVGGAEEVMGTTASQPNDTQMLESPEASEKTQISQPNDTQMLESPEASEKTPTSQPNDTQMLESPEASEKTPVSQANDTEILSETSEPDSRLFTTTQRSGEENMHQASETPVSRSNKTNAELKEYEDVNHNSPGVVEVGKENGSTSPNCASVPDACSHRRKEILLFGHVLGSAGCHQPASSSDQLPPSNNLTSATNAHLITPEAGSTDKRPENQIENSLQFAELLSQIPMVATATRLEQQYQRPLRTTINPQQPTAVIPPARAESEYLGLSDVLLRPQEGSSTNVLQTEMIMLTNLNSLIAQRHEHKTLQLQSACEAEIAKVRQEYNGLMHDAEAEFTKCKKNLEMICDKICQHQILTKEIQEILRKNIVNISDATTGSGLSSLQQSTTESQMQVTQCPASIPIMPSTTTLPMPNMDLSSSPPPLQLQQHFGPSSTVPSPMASALPNMGPTSSPSPLQSQLRSGPSSTLPSTTALSVDSVPNASPSSSQAPLQLQQVLGPSSTLPSTTVSALPNMVPSSSPTQLRLFQHSGLSSTSPSTAASLLPNTGRSWSPTFQLQQRSGEPPTAALWLPNPAPSSSSTPLQSQQLSGPSSTLPSTVAPLLPNTGVSSIPTPLQLQQFSGPSSTLPSTMASSLPDMVPSSRPTPSRLRRRSGPLSTLPSTMALPLSNIDPSSSQTSRRLRQRSGPSSTFPSTTDLPLPNVAPFSSPTLLQAQRLSGPLSALPSTMPSLPNMGLSSSLTPPQLQQLSGLSSTLTSTTASLLPNMGPFSIQTGQLLAASPSVQPISEAQLFAAVFNSQMRAHPNVMLSAGGVIIRAPAPHLHPSRPLPSQDFRHLRHSPN